MKKMILCCPLFVSACFPFVLPPSKISYGVGTIQGSESEVVGQTRIGVSLDGVQTQDDKPFDVELGYIQTDSLSSGERVSQGGYASATRFFGLGKPWRTSLGALVALQSGLSYSVGGQVGIELYGRGDGDFSESTDEGFVAGVYSGTFALGLALEGQQQVFDDQTLSLLMLRASLEIPLLLGIFFGIPN